MIDYLFHYYRKGSRPFQSLSALPEAQAQRLMTDLYVRRSVLWQRFGNPVEYLRLRRQVEHALCSQFKEKGGCPQQDYPIYFVVGRPKWAVAAADAVTLETTAEMRITLSIPREEEISFTYPDSMLCAFLRQMNIDPNIDPEYDGNVFTLKEMQLLVKSKGLPVEGWKPNMPAHLSHYIEMQTWNQTVLEEYLNSVGWSS